MHRTRIVSLLLASATVVAVGAEAPGRIGPFRHVSSSVEAPARPAHQARPNALTNDAWMRAAEMPAERDGPGARANGRDRSRRTPSVELLTTPTPAMSTAPVTGTAHPAGRNPPGDRTGREGAARRKAGPDTPRPATVVRSLVSPYWQGGKTVALTFDDGPSPWTPRILAVLRRRHVPATFCMIGSQAARYPAYARQVVTDGHQLCNHSEDHADMTKLTAPRARREVVTAERRISDAAGAAPLIFRYPYGAVDDTAQQAVRRSGMRELSWDLDPKDWTRPPAGTITARIAARVHRHSVVLLHDGGGDRSRTLASLDATITVLQRRGYRFVPA